MPVTTALAVVVDALTRRCPTRAQGNSIPKQSPHDAAICISGKDGASPLMEDSVDLLELLLKSLEEVRIDVVHIGIFLLQPLEDGLETLVVDVRILPTFDFVLLEVLAKLHLAHARLRRGR